MREDALLGAQAIRQGVEQARRDDQVARGDRRERGAGGGDAVLAADAAARVDDEAARIALGPRAAEQIHPGGGQRPR